MPISFKPLHQHFAAEVRGFDMRQPIDATVTRVFEEAMDRYGILVFPAQQIEIDPLLLLFVLGSP